MIKLWDKKGAKWQNVKEVIKLNESKRADILFLSYHRQAPLGRRCRCSGAADCWASFRCLDQPPNEWQVGIRVYQCLKSAKQAPATNSHYLSSWVGHCRRQWAHQPSAAPDCRERTSPWCAARRSAASSRPPSAAQSWSAVADTGAAEADPTSSRCPSRGCCYPRWRSWQSRVGRRRAPCTAGPGLCLVNFKFLKLKWELLQQIAAHLTMWHRLTCETGNDARRL